MTKGIAKGIVEGRVEGRAEGRVEGRAEGTRRAIRILLEKHFPSLTQETALESIEDVDNLDHLFRKLLDANSTDEARKALDDVRVRCDKPR